MPAGWSRRRGSCCGTEGGAKPWARPASPLPCAIAAPRRGPWRWWRPTCRRQPPRRRLLQQGVDRLEVRLGQVARGGLELELRDQRVEPRLHELRARVGDLALGVEHVDVDAHADFVAEL